MRFYSARNILHLFLVFAFPFHVWSFLMAFRDFGWVAERTEVWDSIGLVSYSLVFALVETMGFLLIMLVLSTLVTGKWQFDKKMGLIGTLGLAVVLWAILYQVYALVNSPLPAGLVSFLIQISHPLRLLWGSAGIVVIASVAAPVYLIIRSDRFTKGVADFFERMTLISTIYLVFDIAGVVIIIVRNLIV